MGIHAIDDVRGERVGLHFFTELVRQVIGVAAAVLPGDPFAE